MAGRWRIRTRSRVVVVSVARSPGTRNPIGVASLLTDLRFELGAHNREVLRTLTEIRHALGAFGASAAADDDFRSLEGAVYDGTLSIEEVRVPTIPPGLELLDPDAEPPPPPEPPPQAPEPPVTNKWIKVRVVHDADGGAIKGVRIAVKHSNAYRATKHRPADDGLLHVTDLSAGTATIDGLEHDEGHWELVAVETT